MCEMIQLKLTWLRHVAVMELWFYYGPVKVLITQRASNKVLLAKRWKSCAPLATLQNRARTLSVSKMGVG